MSPRRSALAAALLAFIVLAATAPGIAVVWDEGEYLWRADEALAWVRGDASPTRASRFSEAGIIERWKFVTWDEGHPAAGILPMAAAKGLAGRRLDTVTAGRLGVIALFSLACGAVAFRLGASYGAVAAAAGPVALLTLPRLFAEAHFATLDGQLTAWWLMLWAAESSPSVSLASSIGCGVLAGMTSATKFTGWLAWGPIGLLRLFSGRRSRMMTLPVIGVAGLLTFYLVNPPLWHHPISAFVTHVSLNTGRTLNVPVSFFGQIYDLQHRLPWFNTTAWLLIVTPVPLLLLGAVGLGDVIRRRDVIGIGVVLNCAALMIARATPVAPPHDGVRLFVTAFAFWAILAAIGAQHLWSLSRSVRWQARGHWLRAVLVIGLGANAVTVARYYPQTLSHYNLLVGGVRGAAAMGLEPTYYGDSLDPDVLGWINRHTTAEDKVAFSAMGSIRHLRGLGRLTPQPADRNRDSFKWFVLQNRTGFLGPSDRWLLANVTPTFVKYPGHHTADNVPADLKVPLLYIFTGEEYQRAVAAVTGR